MVLGVSNVGHSSYIPAKNKSSDNTDDQIKSLQSQADELKKQISEIRSGASKAESVLIASTSLSPLSGLVLTVLI